jgi:nitrogen regulatory protein P-II 1
MSLHLVTAIIKPHVLDDVMAALEHGGANGLTVSEVQGYGRQRGKTETFRGSEYTLQFVPKIKIEVLVDSTDVETVLKTVMEAGRTGKIGDGKIWAVDVTHAARIRTGEMGVDAI